MRENPDYFVLVSSMDILLGYEASGNRVRWSRDPVRFTEPMYSRIKAASRRRDTRGQIIPCDPSRRRPQFEMWDDL